jgi:hypothetical protein
LNGANSIKETGPNHAAGIRWHDNLDGEGSDDFYWSSLLSPYYENLAYNIGFHSNYWGWNND